MKKAKQKLIDNRVQEMAQESVLETDNGIIITNNVELSTVRNSSGIPNNTPEEVQTLRRHNISISSIDSSSTASSSGLASESEDDDTKPDCTDIQNTTNEYLSNMVDIPNEDGTLPIVENSPAHNISSIAIKNSTNVRIGNTQEFHAPVTIQQFMMDEERKRWTEVKNGVVNDGFVKSFNDITSSSNDNNNASDAQPAKDVVPKIQKKLQNYYFIGTICCCLIVALVILITFVVIHANSISGTQNRPQRGDGDDSRKNIPIISTIDSSRVNDTSIFRFVTRDEWIAQPPNNPLTLLELPSTRVIIAHTATEGCNTQAQCTFRVRFIQTFHIESRSWDDIGYNFLVGGDGAIYEGRGWLQQGAHTLRYNTKSIGIAFIGTFNKILPPPRAISAALLLIQEGVNQKYLTEDYKLYGHRQLIPSESPGEALYNVIKNWTHWTSEI